jgi:hypothetical protein
VNRAIHPDKERKQTSPIRIRFIVVFFGSREAMSQRTHFITGREVSGFFWRGVYLFKGEVVSAANRRRGMQTKQGNGNGDVSAKQLELTAGPGILHQAGSFYSA